MRKLLILVVILLLIPTAAWASPVSGVDVSGQSKLTVVVFLDPLFQQNQKAFNVIKEGLHGKFSNADIIYFGDGQTKSTSFLEFMEKVQTDPLNDKGIIWIKEEHLRKFGQDTNSNFVILLSLNVTGYNGYNDYWSKLLLSAYDVDAAKPIAVDVWRKGKTRAPSKGAEYYVTKLQNDFTWPITAAISEPLPEDMAKPAIVVFLPEEILENQALVQNIRTTIASKFKVSNIPIYNDNTPKSSAFVSLVNKVNADSAKQGTTIVRKEYLSEYGKQTKSNQVIAIKISFTNYDVNLWTGTSVYRMSEEILVVDTETNKYLSSTTYDTGSNKGPKDGVELLMNKLQTEFVWP